MAPKRTSGPLRAHIRTASVQRTAVRPMKDRRRTDSPQVHFSSRLSTCFRIGSKFRCIRSTPTEMQSTSENDFECFASTGVNTPGTM